VDAGLASTQRFRVVAWGDARESRLRPRTDALPPRRPTAAELADTVKYELVDPAEAADTMLGMELPPAVICRRWTQRAAMVAVLATAIAGYVSIIA
jgi:hypothetical protein